MVVNSGDSTPDEDEIEISFALIDPVIPAAAEVLKFVIASGLTPLPPTTPGVFRAKGTKDVIGKAFHVHLYRCCERDREFLHHEEPVHLPDELSGVVRWVFGLDTAGEAVHTGMSLKSADTDFYTSRRAGAVPEAAPAETEAAPAETEAATTVGVSTTSYTVPQLRELYDFPEGDGEGRCIGIISLSGTFRPEDMDVFFKSVGVEPPDIKVFWKEGRYKFGDDPVNDYQLTQNIQLVGALLPKARIVVYNRYRTGQTECYEALSAAVDDTTNNPQVMVLPWLFIENPSRSFGAGINIDQASHFEKLFEKCTSKGMTICVASGSTGGLFPVSAGVEWPAVYYPASSPQTLAIGATSLHTHDGEPHNTVWNRAMFAMTVETTASNGGATSGGYSAFYKPPEYQQKLSNPYLGTYSWNCEETLVVEPGSRGCGVPDVSIVGDVFTGVKLYFNGKWGVSGGTGVSVSLWGALITLLNEYIYPGDPSASLGFLNERLYQLALTEGSESFVLVAGGHNGVWDAPSNRKWNACCGLGVPNGKQLAEALKAQIGASPAETSKS